MLARVDRLLGPLSWLAAGAVVLMLLIGPRIVAHDKGAQVSSAAPYPGGGGTGAPSPAKLFTDRCGSCHTLSAAKTSGTIGPKLDGLKLDAATVAATVKAGPGLMPSFTGQLSDAQIQAVAAFVAKSSGG